jgi:hypothetical protein
MKWALPGTVNFVSELASRVLARRVIRRRELFLKSKGWTTFVALEPQMLSQGAAANERPNGPSLTVVDQRDQVARRNVEKHEFVSANEVRGRRLYRGAIRCRHA